MLLLTETGWKIWVCVNDFFHSKKLNRQHGSVDRSGLVTPHFFSHFDSTSYVVWRCAQKLLPFWCEGSLRLFDLCTNLTPINACWALVCTGGTGWSVKATLLLTHWIHNPGGSSCPWVLNCWKPMKGRKPVAWLSASVVLSPSPTWTLTFLPPFYKDAYDYTECTKIFQDDPPSQEPQSHLQNPFCHGRWPGIRTQIS